jgi:DNA mismatch endonuclease, patch repair protein
MSDTVNKAKRSSIMRAVKSRDTSPEMYVRRALHAQGFRYRLHAKHLPGRPDLTFAHSRTTIFVNGCFWHWHGCPRSRMPKSNSAYWQKKIDQNVRRDQRNYELLRSTGWVVIVIWECELAPGVQTAADYLRTTR